MVVLKMTQIFFWLEYIDWEEKFLCQSKPDSQGQTNKLLLEKMDVESKVKKEVDFFKSIQKFTLVASFPSFSWHSVWPL